MLGDGEIGAGECELAKAVQNPLLNDLCALHAATTEHRNKTHKVADRGDLRRATWPISHSRVGDPAAPTRRRTGTGLPGGLPMPPILVASGRCAGPRGLYRAATRYEADYAREGVWVVAGWLERESSFVVWLLRPIFPPNADDVPVVSAARMSMNRRRRQPLRRGLDVYIKRKLSLVDSTPNLVQGQFHGAFSAR
jgi:hypothetical protein